MAEATVNTAPVPLGWSSPKGSKLPACVIQHDFFNLAVIAILISITVAFLITGSLGIFSVLWWSAMGYFILDCIWVTVQPACVKGAGLIIVHHIVTAVYILLPLYHPEYATLMGYNLLVEINTWLLILKRHYKSPVLEAAFYITWVGMRLIVYPWMTYWFVLLYRDLWAIGKLTSHFNMILLGPLIQGYLSLMNFWWTGVMLSQMLGKKGKKSSGEKVA